MQHLAKEELSKVSARNLPIKSGDGRTAETAHVLQEINQFEAPSLPIQRGKYELSLNYEFHKIQSEIERTSPGTA